MCVRFPMNCKRNWNFCEKNLHVFGPPLGHVRFYKGAVGFALQMRGHSSQTKFWTYHPKFLFVVGQNSYASISCIFGKYIQKTFAKLYLKILAVPKLRGIEDFETPCTIAYIVIINISSLNVICFIVRSRYSNLSWNRRVKLNS